MKRQILVILAVFCFSITYSQNNISFFTDFNPILNEKESNFLNSTFVDQREEFDFLNKKIGFAFVDDIILTNKNKFYKVLIQKDFKNFRLIILSELEKSNSGGYDAIILINSVNNISKKIIQENDIINDKLLEEFSKRELTFPNHLYDIGIEDSSKLNNLEADYFNKILVNKKQNFDFKDKKIGFFIGSSGNTLSSKKKYFDNLKGRLSNNYSGSSDQLVILTEAQKKESGGYDAIIVSWSKVLIKTATNSMIKKLKE